MRIVLDTNVLVAAFLTPHSHSAKILRLVLQGSIEIVADNRVLDEYEEVLARPKFKLPSKEVLIVMEMLRLRCINPPSLTKSPKLPDKDDAPFVESAISGLADCIVTGNKKHYPVNCCKGIKILNPAELIVLLDEINN